MSLLSFTRDRGANEISLDEDVYVVIGDSGQSSTAISAWPAVGTYGPVPKGGIVGRPEAVLDSIGPELWKAKRQGKKVCLRERCEHYGPASALLWAADCVEHLAKRIYGVEGNVVEALALARRYATEHVYHSEQTHPLMAEIDTLSKRLHHSGLEAVVGEVIGGAFEGAVTTSGEKQMLRHADAEHHAEVRATVDLRSMQVALLNATKELCGADPLLSAREAARYCRKAAKGKDMPDGGEPEAKWQAQQLLKYLMPPPTDQAVPAAADQAVAAPADQAQAS